MGDWEDIKNSSMYSEAFVAVLMRMRDSAIVSQGPLFSDDDDESKPKWKWLRPGEICEDKGKSD